MCEILDENSPISQIDIDNIIIEKMMVDCDLSRQEAETAIKMWNELSASNEEPDNLDVMAEELIDDAYTEQDVYNDESQEEVDLNEIHPDNDSPVSFDLEDSADALCSREEYLANLEERLFALSDELNNKQVELDEMNDDIEMKLEKLQASKKEFKLIKQKTNIFGDVSLFIVVGYLTIKFLNWVAH